MIKFFKTYYLEELENFIEKKNIKYLDLKITPVVDYRNSIIFDSWVEYVLVYEEERSNER